MSKVVIIILSYKNNVDTIECVQSLLNLNYHDFQILVIDNSETSDYYNQLEIELKKIDNSLIAIKEDQFESIYEGKIILVKANYNRGFSAGNNVGLKYLHKLNFDGFVWLLNNDTTVDNASLSELIKFHNRHQNIGLIGNRILDFYQPNLLQSLGGKFNEQFYLSTHLGANKNHDYTSENQIDYIIGASMFFPMSFVNIVGFLSEDYFLYYEELDWVYRGKKFNYKVDICSTSLVYHKEGKSIGSSFSGKKSEFSELELFKSRKIFISKYYTLGYRYYFSTSLLILNRFRKGKFSLSWKLLKKM